MQKAYFVAAGFILTALLIFGVSGLSSERAVLTTSPQYSLPAVFAQGGLMGLIPGCDGSEPNSQVNICNGGHLGDTYCGTGSAGTGCVWICTRESGNSYSWSNGQKCSGACNSAGTACAASTGPKPKPRGLGINNPDPDEPQDICTN